MAQFLEINAIKVKSNRQRRNFDFAAIEDLGVSMGDTPFGLMSAIVVEILPDGIYLIVGERRLRAAKSRAERGQTIKFAGEPVPLGFVPAVNIKELDDVSRYEAELDENIRRVDLTVVEKAIATANLLKLRTMQAERDGKAPVTSADIARELYEIPADKPPGQAQTTVRDQLMIARHADNPEVQKATSIKDAVKIIKREEAARESALLATTTGASYTTASLILTNEDSMIWAQNAPAGQFDIILTDPPYGMGADEFGDSGSASSSDHRYDDSYENWKKLMAVFPIEAFRLAQADAHAYVFCDLDRFHELKELMTFAGWKVHRTPLIWHNPDGFRQPWPEHGPQRKYEFILFAMKGKKKVNSVRPDVLSYRKDESLNHPAQKPVALLSDLLSRSARPDSVVWDPFTGTGATMEAAYSSRLKCVAQEDNKQHYGSALKRIGTLSAFDPALF